MTASDPNEIRKDLPAEDTQKDQTTMQPEEESSSNKTTPTNGSKSGDDQKTPATIQESNRVTNPSDASVKSNLTASWLSYGALSDLAVTVAQNLNEKLEGSDKILVSAGDSILADLRQWLLVHSMLNGAQTYCDSILNQYPEAGAVRIENAGTVFQSGLETGTAILTALSGIFQLFKTTTTITQHQTELDHDAIVSAIVAQILIIKPHVVIKSLRSMEMRPIVASEGLQALAKLMHSRSKAAVLAASQKDKTGKKVELEALVKLIDQIVERLLLFAGGEIVGSIMNGERIRAVLEKDNILLLDLKPILGGGDQIKIERSFFHSKEYYFNGVAAVSYTLVDSEGKILATGNIQKHTGYKRYDMVDTGIWGTSMPSSNNSEISR